MSQLLVLDNNNHNCDIDYNNNVDNKLIQNKCKPNHNINAIRVQNEFMDAMSNAIIRFLDKHKDSNKTKAEESVFIALGYDISIELELNVMKRNLSHFRRHHIMRNRDAIRSFRIKKIHENVLKMHPKYRNEEVLMHLTQKLNSISPADNKEIDTSSSKSKSISINDDNVSDATYMKHIAIDKHITKIQNVNYTINNQCAATANNNKIQSQNKLVGNRVKKSSIKSCTNTQQNLVIKYKKKKKPNIVSTKATSLMSSNKKLNIIVAQQNAYRYQTPFYVMDDLDELQVAQKIKLHKNKKAKSRKRKFAFNNEQPPMKRVRKELIHHHHHHHHRKGAKGIRGRSINKTRRARAINEGSDNEQTTTNSQHIL